MEVYIEYVIIDNYLLDYLLLKLTHLEGKKRVFKWGLHYGSAVGTFVALLLPLISLPTIFLFLIKILLGAVMLIVSAKYNSFGQFLSAYARFLALTFAFGGAIYAVLGALQIDYSILYGTNSVFPLGIIILLAILIYKACYNFFCLLYEKKLIYPFVRECELVCGDKSICFTGLIDSGNQLIYDRFSSVSVAGVRLTKQLLKEGFFDGGSIGTLEVKTISGRAKILLFRFDYLKIYFKGKANIIEGPIIGVGEKINLSESYDLIIGAECVKGEL